MELLLSVGWLLEAEGGLRASRAPLSAQAFLEIVVFGGVRGECPDLPWRFRTEFSKHLTSLPKPHSNNPKGISQGFLRIDF